MIKLKRHKKLIRLISAVSDMADSIHAGNLLLRGVRDEFRGHLFLSMVVAYGRPFTENYGVGHIRCDYPNYPSFGDADMLHRHARLLDLRNKLLAHSSAEVTRIRIIPPNVADPLDGTKRSKFYYNIGKLDFAEIDNVEWLRVAPLTFHQRLQSDIEQILEQEFGGHAGLNEYFEIPTGHENFKWT